MIFKFEVENCALTDERRRIGKGAGKQTTRLGISLPARVVILFCPVPIVFFELLTTT